MANLHALILAGGASSRFWPLSGDQHPKYLLRVNGSRRLIELAYTRAAACVPAGNIHVVTTRAQADGVRSALPDLPAGNLCIEPARRDTAAVIALGCKAIATREPGADVLVLPADTMVEPASALVAALNAARSAPGFESAIHVFGVPAARPEGGFGYIDRGKQVVPGVFGVNSFVEKPGDRAAAIVAKGFLWNIGCFLFRLTTFDRELATHMPELRKHIAPTKPGTVSTKDYEGLPSVSIDYGLIEKTTNLRVALVNATFDDVGTWDTLLRTGASGSGTLVSVGGANNTAVAPGRTVAVVGESDLLVVADGDRILVMKRGAGQQVKQAAQALEPNRDA